MELLNIIQKRISKLITIDSEFKGTIKEVEILDIEESKTAYSVTTNLIKLEDYKLIERTLDRLSKESIKSNGDITHSDYNLIEAMIEDNSIVVIKEKFDKNSNLIEIDEDSKVTIQVIFRVNLEQFFRLKL